MQTRAILREYGFAMFLGASRQSEAGAPADAVKRIGVVVDNARQPDKRQQSPVEGGAFLEIPDRNVNVGDAVDFHEVSLPEPIHVQAGNVLKAAADSCRGGSFVPW